MKITTILLAVQFAAVPVCCTGASQQYSGDIDISGYVTVSNCQVRAPAPAAFGTLHASEFTKATMGAVVRSIETSSTLTGCVGAKNFSVTYTFKSSDKSHVQFDGGANGLGALVVSKSLIGSVPKENEVYTNGDSVKVPVDTNGAAKVPAYIALTRDSDELKAGAFTGTIDLSYSVE